MRGCVSRDIYEASFDWKTDGDSNYREVTASGKGGNWYQRGGARWGATRPPVTNLHRMPPNDSRPRDRRAEVVEQQLPPLQPTRPPRVVGIVLMRVGRLVGVERSGDGAAGPTGARRFVRIA